MNKGEDNKGAHIMRCHMVNSVLFLIVCILCSLIQSFVAVLIRNYKVNISTSKFLFPRTSSTITLKYRQLGSHLNL